MNDNQIDELIFMKFHIPILGIPVQEKSNYNLENLILQSNELNRK